jgi:hypothetical protein
MVVPPKKAAKTRPRVSQDAGFAIPGFAIMAFLNPGIFIPTLSAGSNKILFKINYSINKLFPVNPGCRKRSWMVFNRQHLTKGGYPH